MKLAEVAHQPTDELVHAFRKAAVEHTTASSTGQHETANRNHDLLRAVGAELRARGRDAQAMLLVLLRDSNHGVKLWAAVESLEFASEHAEGVLNELSAGPPGVARLAAEMSLREWRTKRR